MELSPTTSYVIGAHCPVLCLLLSWPGMKDHPSTGSVHSPNPNPTLPLSILGPVSHRLNLLPLYECIETASSGFISPKWEVGCWGSFLYCGSCLLVQQIVICMFLIQYTSSGLPTQSALNQLIFIVVCSPLILSTALKFWPEQGKKKKDLEFLLKSLNWDSTY